MSEPVFLTIDQVCRLHADLVERYGGHAGVRDMGLLQSAVDTPRTSFNGEFLHPGIVEMAAAYLFHISRNHPFIDGNKRTGAAAALVFLFVNEMEIDADEDSLASITLTVADSTASKDDLTAWFHDHCL